MKKVVRRNHIRESFRTNLKLSKNTDQITEVAPLIIAARLAIPAIVSAAKKYGPSIGSSIMKMLKPKTKPQPWGKPAPKGKGTTPKGKGSKGRDLTDIAAGIGIGATALGGGSQPLDIYGKDRPQTGFRDRFQGIDPFRSGEMRASAGYYDTPVGRRQLYKGAGGGLVAPPNTMYEQLQEMVNKSIKAKEINDILVTQDMARNIVQLHEALNNDNKKILEENIQSKDGFFRTLDFSVRN